MNSGALRGRRRPAESAERLQCAGDRAPICPRPSGELLRGRERAWTRGRRLSIRRLPAATNRASVCGAASPTCCHAKSRSPDFEATIKEADDERSILHRLRPNFTGTGLQSPLPCFPRGSWSTAMTSRFSSMLRISGVMERTSLPASSGAARIAHNAMCDRYSSADKRPLPTSNMSGSFQCPGPAIRRKIQLLFESDLGDRLPVCADVACGPPKIGAPAFGAHSQTSARPYWLML